MNWKVDYLLRVFMFSCLSAFVTPLVWCCIIPNLVTILSALGATCYYICGNAMCGFIMMYLHFFVANRRSWSNFLAIWNDIDGSIWVWWWYHCLVVLQTVRHASVLALTNSNGQLWIWLAFESVVTSGNLIEETTYWWLSLINHWLAWWNL